MRPPGRIVICGGGAIGVAIAYFLSLRGAAPIVIERHEVAGSASGKSGGFLARDWCRGSALDALARRSFDLHAELAETLAIPWGYRRLETFAGHASANGSARGVAPRPWLSAEVTLTGRIGSPQTTALVEPRGFTRGLMRAAEQRGRDAARGRGRGLARAPMVRCRGVVLADGETVEADAVVIAMGPWSVLAARWLPLPCGLRLQGPQPDLRHRHARAGRSAVPRISGGRRRGADTRAVRACRRHDLGVRGVEHRADAGRSGGGDAPTTARTDGSRRCAGGSRRRWPTRRSWRARPASARSPRTACR
jgi:2-polyprenyl-6-methoxyphenol hydroxylase-like FAD-dependent oxidoreductase